MTHFTFMFDMDDPEFSSFAEAYFENVELRHCRIGRIRLKGK